MSKVKLNTAIVSGFVSGIFIAPNGNAITLRMLIDNSYFNNETQQWVNKSESVNVKAFNENKISRYKELMGSTIIVEGNVRTNQYDKQDGSKVYETYILANKVTLVETNEKYKEEHPIDGNVDVGGGDGIINLDGIDE